MDSCRKFKFELFLVKGMNAQVLHLRQCDHVTLIFYLKRCHIFPCRRPVTFPYPISRWAVFRTRLEFYAENKILIEASRELFQGN